MIINQTSICYAIFDNKNKKGPYSTAFIKIFPKNNEYNENEIYVENLIRSKPEDQE